MKDNIRELQNRLFGAVHDFHTDRTANMLEVLTEKYGEEVLETIEEAGANRYELYRWHLERTVNMLDTLKEKYGPEAADIVLENERVSRHKEGVHLAQEYGDNSFEKLIHIFTGGDSSRILERRENEVLIKTQGCFAGKIARELGRAELLYGLHCGLDWALTEGFNDKFGCEIVQTIMEGYDCCIHRLFVKP